MNQFKGDTKFDFTVAELRTAAEACNILKDMSALPYEEGKKLQKNISIISPLLVPLQDEANIIDGRKDDINERVIKATTPEALEGLKKDRTSHNEEVRKFNNKKHSVMLFIIPEEKFITTEEDKAKFGAKKFNQKEGHPPLEVERYPYFLELIGLGIITEKK